MRPALLAATAALLLSSTAFAQDVPPKIWDVPHGTPIDALGVDFVEPACGTNGGPPSVTLASFSDFAQCPAEVDGLREIWFRYDDTIEYLARAMRNPVQAIRMNFTKIGMQPAILSFLVDEEGRIRGFRAHTDPAADPQTRYDHHLAAAIMKTTLSPEGWVCEDLPRLEGEGEIEGHYVKERCTLTRDDITAVSEARFYLKPGQAVVDPATGRPMLNAFESAAFMEVKQNAPYPPDPEVATAEQPAAPAASDKVGQFLAGLTADCPGCDLSGADLRRRDLSGADLTGAKLVATNLHRTVLRGAKLAGADLERADLNLADLTQADFTDANLTGAMLFNAVGAQTNFTGADLVTVRAGSLDLRQATFDGATITGSDFGQARLNNASFAGADLSGSYFYQANLVRANFTDVKA
ncbi:MAG TPA: pentapeptide repeat-containing protein, partial [Devosia sp.]|nr:pentapeptide repeat-containing protein [Devosia sp.]